jgi:subtilisin family serine protease
MIKLRTCLSLFVCLWLGMVLVPAHAAPAQGLNTIPAPTPTLVPALAPQQILVLMPLLPEHFRLHSGYDGSYGNAEAQSARRHMARRIARKFGLTLVDDWPMILIGLDCFVMAVPDGQSATDAAERVSRNSHVAFAEPMHVYQTQGGPPVYNDPLYPVQPDARAWRLADLHEISTGRGVTIAVIDSGIETTHPDLAGQVTIIRNFVANYSLVEEVHGTSVAGIIAARGGNGIGIVGVAPGARLMGLRACWQQPGRGGEATYCDSLSLAKALHFAVERRAQVINMSLAGPQDLLLGKLLDIARLRGASIVAAVDQMLPGGGFPASHRGVMAVADESLSGLRPDVYTAPGRDVPTTQPGGRWALVNGSSYAAAHVAGLLALLRAEQSSTGILPTLIAARVNGGAIDACASLLHRYGPYVYACARPSRIAENRRH